MDVSVSDRRGFWNVPEELTELAQERDGFRDRECARIGHAVLDEDVHGMVESQLRMRGQSEVVAAARSAFG